VKVEVPAPYGKTTEQADPVSCQDLLVEALHCYRPALPSTFCPAAVLYQATFALPAVGDQD
jgi:hypothetical protein